jgi:hypothetical protein
MCPSARSGGMGVLARRWLIWARLKRMEKEEVPLFRFGAQHGKGRRRGVGPYSVTPR